MGNAVLSDANPRYAIYGAGLCLNCRQPRDTDKVLCADCRKRQSAGRKELTQSRIKDKKCRRCGEPSLPDCTFCRPCWFYNVAAVTTKNVYLAQALNDLYDSQKGLCAYTDEPLVLGINASLDHKLPQCRGGSHAIENLQWVSKRINKNKFNLSHEEFVAECAHIAAKFT